jgi:hypothetical protein
MNHLQLHREMSDVFHKLKKGTLNPQQAKELNNCAGKILKNAVIELKAIQMGFGVDVPLLAIKQINGNSHKKLKK